MAAGKPKPVVGRAGERPIALHSYSHYDHVHDYAAPDGQDHVKMFKISSADYSQRPARTQIAPGAGKALQQAEGCNEYNIWYDKWVGEHWGASNEMRAAPHRCSIRSDAGRTKANDRFGEGHAYCCIFFARGCCSNGAECTFLHRIPNAHDESRLSMVRDIFGRERHNSDKQDMRGTGNFNKESRTLYIGGLILRRGARAAFQTLLRHLSEWGEVEQLRMIPNKAIAFVTYKLRSAAEFALEAMHCQTLELDELLNMRWAYDDPNPKVRAEIQAKQHEMLREAVEAKGYDTTDAEYFHPGDYAMPQSADTGKRGRNEYPDTDAQYGSSYAYLAVSAAPQPPAKKAVTQSGSTGDSAPGDFTPQSREDAEKAAALETQQQAHQAQLQTQSKLAALLDGVDGREQEQGVDGRGQRTTQGALEKIGWGEAYDANGKRYYYEKATGVSSWVCPLESGGGAAGKAGDVGDWETRVQQYAGYYGLSVAEAERWLRQQWAGSGAEGQGAGGEAAKGDGGEAARGGGGEATRGDGDEDADLQGTEDV